MTNELSDEFVASLNALGDQLQQACNATELSVIGFVVLVEQPGSDTHFSAETRARVDRTTFTKLLAQYVTDEIFDPRDDEAAS